MNFERRDFATCDAIAKRDACVRECAWIEDDSREATIGPFADFIDERAFVVALEAFNFHAERFRRFVQIPFEVFERRFPVNFWLS